MNPNDFDICLENYNGSDALVVIPPCVTEIGDGAFRCNDTLRRVVIPEGVRELGEFAFADCSALEEVTLPASLAEWDWSAFEDCDALRLFHVPAGSWVRQFPDVLDVPAVDMDGRPLPPVAVDDSEWLYEISGGEVTLNGRKHSRAGTLYPVEDSATTLYIPRELAGKPVTAIGEKAFADDPDIDALYLPDGLLRIEKGAFANCYVIDMIRVPESLDYIAPGAFYECCLSDETEDRLNDIRGYDPEKDPDEDGDRSGGGGRTKLHYALLDLVDMSEADYRDELETLGVPQSVVDEVFALIRANQKLQAVKLLQEYAPDYADSSLGWAIIMVTAIYKTL